MLWGYTVSLSLPPEVTEEAVEDARCFFCDLMVIVGGINVPWLRGDVRGGVLTGPGNLLRAC